MSSAVLRWSDVLVPTESQPQIRTESSAPIGEMTHAYLVTPEALMSRFKPDILGIGNRTRVAPQGFGCPRVPLDGTGFTYQLAVSRKAQTDVGGDGLPDSGDSRSGVIVFDGDRIVSSYVASAISRHRHLAVDKAYRGQGLGVLMVELWMREATFSRASIGLISYRSASIAVESYRRAVAWAVDSGKDVPADVRAAVEDPERLARVIARFKTRPRNFRWPKPSGSLNK